MTDEAFDELLDRAAAIEAASAPEEEEERRRQFAISVDRAVKRATTRKDGRAWMTHTLKRHECRLHFFREGRRVYLVACLPLDSELGDE